GRSIAAIPEMPSSPGSRRVEARLISPTVKSSPRRYGPTSLSSQYAKGGAELLEIRARPLLDQAPTLTGPLRCSRCRVQSHWLPTGSLIDKRVILGACGHNGASA